TSAYIAQTAGQYSGADCSPAQVPGFSKFGFFRTVRQNYDPRYGATELGRTYFANRWNIWKDAFMRDGSGNPMIDPATGQPVRMPYEQRETKPITFYTNVEFPEDQDLFNQAQQVTADWSDALRKTVAGLNLTAATTSVSMDRVNQ